MATYTQIRAIAVNQDYIAIMTVAVVKAAIDVYTEAPTTVNHANRIILAHSVLLSPETWAKLMIWAVAFITTGVTDAEILAAVKLVWNAYAGSD